MNPLSYLWPRLPKVLRLWARHTIEEDPKKSFETVIELSEALSFNQAEFQSYIEDLKKRDPAAHARLEVLKQERLPSRDELLKMSEGSLGRELGEFLRKYNITPESFPQSSSDALDERLKAHLYESHDAWHVVTGFAADDAGELALQAFSLGQDHEDLFAFSILSSGVVGLLLRRPWSLPAVVRLIRRGYSMGRRAEQFVARPWLEWLKRPIEDVRRELRVTV